MKPTELIADTTKLSRQASNVLSRHKAPHSDFVDRCQRPSRQFQQLEEFWRWFVLLRGRDRGP